MDPDGAAKPLMAGPCDVVAKGQAVCMTAFREEAKITFGFTLFNELTKIQKAQTS